MTKRKPCSYCGQPCGKSGHLWHRLVPGPNGCLIWTGALLNGYGFMGGRLVHRTVYEKMVGPIPPGLDLDHLCKNPPCANHYHLEPVTRRENVRRAWADYTHCKHGHELTPDNVYITRPGHRSCRTCTRRQQREYLARKRAAAR